MNMMESQPNVCALGIVRYDLRYNIKPKSPEIMQPNHTSTFPSSSNDEVHGRIDALVHFQPVL